MWPKQLLVAKQPQVSSDEPGPEKVERARKIAALQEAALIIKQSLQEGANSTGVFSSSDMTGVKAIEAVGGILVPLFLQAVISKTNEGLKDLGMTAQGIIAKNAAGEGGTLWLWRRALAHAQHLAWSAGGERGAPPPLMSALGVGLRHRGVDGESHTLLSELGICVNPEVAKCLTYTWAADDNLSPERQLVDTMRASPEGMLGFVVSGWYLCMLCVYARARAGVRAGECV